MPVLQLATTLQPLNSTKACGCCIKKFNALRSKQHCSFCGNVVCKSCTKDAAGTIPMAADSNNNTLHSHSDNRNNNTHSALAAATLAAQSTVVIKKQCTDCQTKARDFKVQSSGNGSSGPAPAKITVGRGTARIRGYGTTVTGVAAVASKKGTNGNAKFSLMETIQHLLGSDPSATLTLDGGQSAAARSG